MGLLVVSFLYLSSYQPGSQLSPLPLSKLPSSCGYTTKSTPQDLVMVAPYDGCFVNQEVGQMTLFVCRSTWILQLVLLSLILEGQLCSVHALVGGAGEDIVSPGQTMFIQPSHSCLLCRGHGCKNGLAPFGH